MTQTREEKLQKKREYDRRKKAQRQQFAEENTALLEQYREIQKKWLC